MGYVLDPRTGAPLETIALRPNESDADAGRAVAVTRSRPLVGGSDRVGVYAPCRRRTAAGTGATWRIQVYS